MATPAYFANLGGGWISRNLWAHIAQSAGMAALGVVGGIWRGAEGVAVAYMLALWLGAALFLVTFHRSEELSTFVMVSRTNAKAVSLAVVAAVAGLISCLWLAGSWGRLTAVAATILGVLCRLGGLPRFDPCDRREGLAGSCCEAPRHSVEGFMIREFTKHALRAMGIEARRYSPQTSDSAKLAGLLDSYDVDCVFDVGANTGQYARGLRTIGYKNRIVSFEPLREAHATLLASSRRDADWVVAPRMAIGDADGEAEINVSANLVSSSLRNMGEAHERIAPDSKYLATERVSVRIVDSVFPEYGSAAHRPLLKIDTQGYELQVLMGATKCLPHFIGVQVELSLTELYVGQELFMDVAGWLTRRHMELVGLFPGLVDMDSGRLLQVDGLFFR